MSSRLNKALAIDIRSDFIVRMRSIGKTRKEIELLNFYLSVSMDNVNDLAKNSANIKKLRSQHPEFKAERVKPVVKHMRG